MIKYKFLNKKGFGHVEMIVFAVVILAIGGIGYLALKQSGASSGIRTCASGAYKDSQVAKHKCVEFTQRMLNGLNVVISNDSEALKVDGANGPKTKATVKKFQQRQNYSKERQTGVMDKLTWKALCTRVMAVSSNNSGVIGSSIHPRIKNAAQAGKSAGCADEGYKEISGSIYNYEGSDDVWNDLAYCESTGNWKAVSNTNPKYYGGLQIGSWAWNTFLKQSKSADQYPKDYQLSQAKILQKKLGWSQWECADSTGRKNHLGLFK